MTASSDPTLRPYEEAVVDPAREHPDNACTKCRRMPPEITLSDCDHCSTAKYCSSECRFNDSVAHDALYCSSELVTIDLRRFGDPNTRLLETQIKNPFACLKNGTWLYNREIKDTYSLLISSFRLREFDNLMFGYTVYRNSVYSGTESLPALNNFLETAKNKNLLPLSWTREDSLTCMMHATTPGFYYVETSSSAEQLLELYGDPLIILQLRLFNEAVYGRGAAGTNGQQLLSKMIELEHTAHHVYHSSLHRDLLLLTELL
ncbi:hypothetical protein PT974_10022 [Cladobotryum mycophilum]|uniref:Suppressor of anucleate metulae protein B n=1 Tax=Cladobotryum mycophilum TaxID=491253 RepID=A0ABR0S8N9_9HYPO